MHKYIYFLVIFLIYQTSSFSKVSDVNKFDQKNLLAWSTMYDNIYESPDAPSEDVINDDDLLDGWTILQKKKREREKAQAELEAKMGDKAQGAGEIFLMAGSKNDAERIETMNDVNATMTKKERLHTIRKSDGPVNQQDLPDEKLKIRSQLNQQYKEAENTRGK